MAEDEDAAVRDDDNDFVVEDIEEGASRKRKYITIADGKEDELPIKYRHVREGLCSVCPEVYVIHVLQSKYHLSHRQAFVITYVTRC